MAITFGEAKKKISQWAGRGGKCPSNDDVTSFVREVLDYMLISGQYGNLRKFSFNAVKGIFTAPYELETPLKVKIDGEMADTWDRWFEFYGYADLDNCLPANAILEEPNTSPLVYDVPFGGAYIGVMPICEESPDANVVIKGFDETGRQIITTHNGETMVGEYLTIKKGVITKSTVRFSRVTEVVKSRTNSYVQLLWLSPDGLQKGFLADYSPFEEKPQYRRFRLNTRCAPCVKVTVLGRIRLKEYYADNDLIPFDSLYTLSVAAQAINSQYNSDAPTAQAKDNMMQSLIKRENDIKKVNTGQPIQVFTPLSGGSIKGIVF